MHLSRFYTFSDQQTTYGKTNGCLSRHVSSDIHTHSVQFADGLSIVFGTCLTLGMHAHAMGHDQLCNIESETNRWSKL